MSQPRFPYGISYFPTVAEEGYVYVDRTVHIETLERLPSRYHIFLRPRRFGKSLFVSVLEHYYGQEHRDKFERLFGKYYIGQHPTPQANSYRVLKFDFSAIDTRDPDRGERAFLANVRTSVATMFYRYPHLFDAEAFAALKTIERPEEVMELVGMLMTRHEGEKIFLLIDEYDHFTNELVAFYPNDFDKVVSRNGFVRKFYESVKKGTQIGVIDRIFITGISPITLDSLTSGFNMADNLTLDLGLHDLMGFREEEISELLRAAGAPEEEHGRILDDVRAWYNGYRFNEEAPHRLYNPDMVLYFIKYYAQYGKYPNRLLDHNITSDYHKISQMARVGNESANRRVIEEVLEEGVVPAELTGQYSFARTWTRDDFVSLLFYLGMLTLREAVLGQWMFEIPNRVIEAVYFDFFQDQLFREGQLTRDDLQMPRRVAALALRDDMEPIASALSEVLGRLSNRDARGWTEKHVKAVLLALLVPTGVYGVFSEWSVGEGYVDIALLRRPPILEPKHEHLIELKYVRKEDIKRLEAVKKEGREQLRRRLSHPDVLRRGEMLGWLITVVGHEAQAERVEVR